MRKKILTIGSILLCCFPLIAMEKPWFSGQQQPYTAYFPTQDQVLRENSYWQSLKENQSQDKKDEALSNVAASYKNSASWEIVRYHLVGALAAGANVNTPISFQGKNRSLLEASIQQNDRIFFDFLTSRAFVDTVIDKALEKALSMNTEENNRSSFIHNLLKLAADHQRKVLGNPNSKISLLQICIIEGAKEAFDTFCEQTTDQKVLDNGLYEALQLLSNNVYQRYFVERLLEYGADANASGANASIEYEHLAKVTPLFFAQTRKLAELLISKGADPHTCARTKSGGLLTLPHTVALSPAHDADLLSLYAEQGVSLISIDRKGEKPADILIDRIKKIVNISGRKNRYKEGYESEETGFFCCAKEQNDSVITIAKKIKLLGKHQALDTENIDALRTLVKNTRQSSKIFLQDPEVSCVLGCMGCVGSALPIALVYLSCECGIWPCVLMSSSGAVIGVLEGSCHSHEPRSNSCCDLCPCYIEPYRRNPMLEQVVQSAIPMPQQMVYSPLPNAPLSPERK
jgi:hypothetical protein